MGLLYHLKEETNTRIIYTLNNKYWSIFLYGYLITFVLFLAGIIIREIMIVAIITGIMAFLMHLIGIISDVPFIIISTVSRFRGKTISGKGGLPFRNNEVIITIDK